MGGSSDSQGAEYSRETWTSYNIADKVTNTSIRSLKLKVLCNMLESVLMYYAGGGRREGENRIGS